MSPNPAARSGVSYGKPVSYTKFSSKLTGSLDQISKMIEDNAKMIDSIQEVALELTGSIGALHTLTVKYAGIANQVLDVLLPFMQKIPLIPQKLTQFATDLEKLTQKIIDGQAATNKTITDVRSGLQTGDVSKLQTHAGDLQNLTKSLSAILPK
jgi:methyl-accepting chemotaxis protein